MSSAPLICHLARCTAERRHLQLFCAPHWRRTPTWLQRKVWAEWNDGAGAVTRGYAAAVRDACTAVESLLDRTAADTPGRGIMPGISVRQPFAQALLLGVKDVENRNWRPAPVHRWLALHAGKALYRFNDPQTGQPATGRQGIIRSVARARIDLGAIWPDMPPWGTNSKGTPQAPRGAILGLIRLAGCVSPADIAEPSPWVNPDARWCWQVAEAIPLPEPLFYSGGEGLFDVDVLTADLLRAAYRAKHPPEARVHA